MTTGQPTRSFTRLAVAIVLAALVIGAAILASSYNLSKTTTQTRTSTITTTANHTRTSNVSQTGTISNTSSGDNGVTTARSNVTGGLQLTAALKPVDALQGQNVTVTARVFDTLSTELQTNVTSLTDPADGPCEQGLATGVEVYQGVYTAANLSKAAELLLYNPSLIYICPEAFTFHYSFFPDSDIASVYTSAGGTNLAGPVSENTILSGYWTGSGQNYTHHAFSQGSFTVVVFDAWGQTTIVYFHVVPQNGTATTSSVSARSASTGIPSIGRCQSINSSISIFGLGALTVGTSAPTVICLRFYYYNSTAPVILNLMDFLSVQGEKSFYSGGENQSHSFNAASNFSIASSQSRLVIGGPTNENEGANITYAITAETGANGTYELGIVALVGLETLMLGPQAPTECGLYGQLVAGDGHPNYASPTSCVTITTPSSSSGSAGTSSSSSKYATITGISYPLAVGDVYFQFVGATNSTSTTNTSSATSESGTRSAQTDVSLKSISTIPISGPSQIVFDPLDNYLYVATITNTFSITVVDVSDNSVVGIIPLGNVTGGLLFDPSNGYVYASLGCFEVLPHGSGFDQIELSTGTTAIVLDGTKVIDEIQGPCASGGLVYDPSDHHIFEVSVADFNPNGLVNVIDDRNNSIVATINVDGASSNGIAYDPSNGMVYVADPSIGSVNVIDPATDTSIATLLVERGEPVYAVGMVVYNPGNSLIYVANGISYGYDTELRGAGVVGNFTSTCTGGITSQFTGFAYDAARNISFMSACGTVIAANGTTNAPLLNLNVTNAAAMIYDPSNQDLYVIELTIGGNNPTPGGIAVIGTASSTDNTSSNSTGNTTRMVDENSPASCEGLGLASSTPAFLTYPFLAMPTNGPAVVWINNAMSQSVTPTSVPPCARTFDFGMMNRMGETFTVTFMTPGTCRYASVLFQGAMGTILVTSRLDNMMHNSGDARIHHGCPTKVHPSHASASTDRLSMLGVRIA